VFKNIYLCKSLIKVFMYHILNFQELTCPYQIIYVSCSLIIAFRRFAYGLSSYLDFFLGRSAEIL
jgi:hypothetical protein